MEEITDKKSVIVGGYGEFGAPFTLIHALVQSKAKDLTIGAVHGGFRG